MRLRARTVAGIETAFEIDSEATLSVVRAQVGVALGLGGGPRLVFGGRLLPSADDDRLARDVGLHDGCTLVATAAPKASAINYVEVGSAAEAPQEKGDGAVTAEAAPDSGQAQAAEELERLQGDRQQVQGTPRWRLALHMATIIAILACLGVGLPLATLLFQELSHRTRGEDMYCGKSSCYSVLEIPRSASEQTLKKAYREAARKVHPDRSTAPDAHEQFLSVGRAYEVLSDVESRSRYDYYLDHPEEDLRNSLHKATWVYQARSGVSVGMVAWTCFIGGLIGFALLRPLYLKVSYFLWRKWRGLPASFDSKLARSKRAKFLKKLEQAE